MKSKITIKPIPGRAYTPEQKRELIERLYNVWLKKPDLRFGQLVYIQSSPYDQDELFYTEDFDLIEHIERELCE